MTTNVYTSYDGTVTVQKVREFSRNVMGLAGGTTVGYVARNNVTGETTTTVRDTAWEAERDAR